MMTLWRSLIDDLGLEPAILVAGYLAFVTAFALSLIAQVVWQVVQRFRVSRELEDVTAQRRRELDSAMNLTERMR